MFVDKKFGDDGILVFADCAVMPDPTDIQLAEIAVSTAKTAKANCRNRTPGCHVEFFNKGSAKHPLVDKVKNATELARKLDPELMIDGELQLDAALIKEVGELKSSRQ